MKKRSRQLWKLGIGLTGLVFFAVGLHIGPHDISPLEALSTVLGLSNEHSYIINDIRLPRVLVAFLSGAVLALSGFYMQVLIRNPLADPYIMGVTAGAGLGVNLLILGIVNLPVVTFFSYPIFAGLGALLSLLLIFLLGFRALMYDTYKLLIAGVAVSSICTALMGLLIFLYADADQIRRIVYWTFGNLERAQMWEVIYIGLAMWLISMAYGWRYGIHLDVLAMGEVQAEQLGLRIMRMKLGLLLISTLTVGALVAFTGPIGFVGMMVPHIARSLFGSMHRQNVIWGSFLGGVFLLAADVLSRVLQPPTGIPIGIVTALVGIPFFLYLLFTQSKFLN